MTAALNATALTVLLENQVNEDEIDSLGHLSVPFYGTRALAASQTLLASHGLTEADLERQGFELTLVDTFMRNYREQFLGARVQVQGGVLDADSDRIRLYHELINPDRDELSATFVHVFELHTSAGRVSSPFDPHLIAELSGVAVDWPEHGRPRSLDLSRPPFQLTLPVAMERNLKSRTPRVITPEECNDAGDLAPLHFPHLPYSGSLETDDESDWVFEFEGKRLGLADLESRSALFSLPRVGDQIQSFSADVGIARKTVRRSHWVFNPDTGRLLTAGSVVMALLDLDARRVVEISGNLKTRFEAQFQPDLV